MISATASSRLPLAHIAAIYLISVPLAWFVTPDGMPWNASVAGLAVGLSWLTGLAPWWLAINAIFVPGLTFALSLEISPLWALAAFVALMLVYGAIWKSRVPLFFSSGRAQDALAALLPKTPHKLLDVGCGDARVLTRLAASRPDSRYDGVEQAFLPWLIGRLRTRVSKGQCGVRRADLWALDFGAYDVVYAYLSPAVMPELWTKALREMRPGALLVSAFPVPGVRADESLDVGDAMRTQLHVWRMAGGAR
jgi:SAM-dependent methyltransferase